MKKMMFFAALTAAVSLASCTTQAPKANMKTEIDSLSYMMGISNTQGLKQYVVGQLGVDTTFMADFIKGIETGAKESTEKEKAYLAGLTVGLQVSNSMMSAINQQFFGADSETKLDRANFVAGFIAGTAEKGAAATMEEAQAYVQLHSETIKEKALEAKYGDNKIAGAKFLEENATKEGVVTTASGLQYKVIKAGKGAVPTAESKVKVHYKGTLLDGTEFDSSYNRNEPTSFRANQVIKGWTEALTMMPVGSKWELYIPQDLAYGAREAGQIKPFSTLIFEVELLAIEK
ncbi:MAG: FKBP-type peptidyl-prolyl cis-trans isomerase [Phocaeicola sp.]